MYENSEADGNIDKATISVSPDGAQRVISAASPARVTFGHCRNEQITKSESFVRVVEADSGRVEEEESQNKCSFAARPAHWDL